MIWIVDEQGSIKCITDHGTVYIDPRPSYCDRGRFVSYVITRHGAPCGSCDVDHADGFPRYYFDLERAKAEMEAWMTARKWVPDPAQEE